MSCEDDHFSRDTTVYLIIVIIRKTQREAISTFIYSQNRFKCIPRPYDKMSKNSLAHLPTDFLDLSTLLMS